MRKIINCISINEIKTTPKERLIFETVNKHHGESRKRVAGRLGYKSTSYVSQIYHRVRARLWIKSMEKKNTKQIFTSLPQDNDYFQWLDNAVVTVTDGEFCIVFDKEMETFVNLSNVFFRVGQDANGFDYPQSLVPACNALLRSLLNLRMAAGVE